jgi:uncharacterized repeat protein (TIGR03803 family)
MKRICAGLLAGLAGSMIVHPVVARETSSERVVYAFCTQSNCVDGATPYAGLIAYKGMLYGTTVAGGAYKAGTVFSLDPGTGAEKVLYSSRWLPTCSLVAMNGALYGTTYTGGDYQNGTVFSVDPDTGAEATVHSFGNGDDGSNPYTGLVRGKDMLYGTTEYGGAYAAGSVYALDPRTGAETLLYSFCSKRNNCGDGAYPYASLAYLHGELYGTTEGGGYHGKGSVFAVNAKTGAHRLLYSFCAQKACKDGRDPIAGVFAANGLLYGATAFGGAHRFGDIFAVDPATRAENVLYSFCAETNCTDGGIPEAAPLPLSSVLYGRCCTRLRGGQDGKNPQSNLIELNGSLYGTTSAGGAGNSGTVFAIKKN